MLLCVEYVVLNVAHVEHPAQFFRNIDGGSTHQHRAACLAEQRNLVNNGVEFLARSFEYQVFLIVADDVSVGRNHHHIQFVDVPQFAGFGFGGTGHTCQLVIHAEVILQSNGGIRLGDFSHLHVFFGFQCLVQAVGITATFHHTACLLVHNLHLPFDDHIFFVSLEKGISLEQLIHGVEALRLHGKILCQLVLGLVLLGLVQILVGIYFYDSGSHVGHYKKGGIFLPFGQKFGAALGEFYPAIFLVYGKQQRFVH